MTLHFHPERKYHGCSWWSMEATIIWRDAWWRELEAGCFTPPHPNPSTHYPFSCHVVGPSLQSIHSFSDAPSPPPRWIVQAFPQFLSRYRPYDYFYCTTHFLPFLPKMLKGHSLTEFLLSSWCVWFYPWTLYTHRELFKCMNRVAFQLGLLMDLHKS